MFAEAPFSDNRAAAGQVTPLLGLELLLAQWACLLQMDGQHMYLVRTHPQILWYQFA